ncbi:hypothetical protein BCF11_4873 [Collimonas sp. PA-H2]|uniref:HORMA-1 domain-containing protein n=1 Tax=Collimonas sp. PA-H2 TaxID=1881062 RepID=UPI000BF7DCC6|nr:hypothetical protein [Collimonas sp. PA-H2]PFH12392.1 hypothetical protein BCF11_4873 [Collimonas sp. PA-H2]
MSSTFTKTETSTYTVADVENVMRRVTADLVMIASSTKAMTEVMARDYAHDIEHLVKNGYLNSVDVTLLTNSNELRATRFNFVTGADATGSSRPGGVRWPEEPSGHIRVVLYYSSKYTTEIKAATSSKLRIGWSPTDADTTHNSLEMSGERGYSSNGFGTDRKDYK